MIFHQFSPPKLESYVPQFLDLILQTYLRDTLTNLVYDFDHDSHDGNNYFRIEVFKKKNYYIYLRNDDISNFNILSYSFLFLST